MSPGKVVGQIHLLHENYGVKEFHILDDVFNFFSDRVAEICEKLINSPTEISLAFPNGLRADILTDELIALLKKAGTYKINFGFETTSPRLQKIIGKNLDIKRARHVIRKTSTAGIIVGAYFMMGFPGQTREEMAQTIDYAVKSKLDLAYFFKATPYPGSEFYKQVIGEKDHGNFEDFHYYSTARSHGDFDRKGLNKIILAAQRRFFSKPSRLLRVFRKTPNKVRFARNLFRVLVLFIQGYILEKATIALKENEK